LSVHYNHISLAETAQYFGYSPAYLSRVIREQTGKTFNSIIAQKQVEQALLLMNAGNLNLTEIAQEIGCFDTSHFNKKFRAVYGISPKAYIEQLRKA
jgi:AraC-like DNA-binding protein